MSMEDAAKVETPELDKRAEIIKSGKAEVVQGLLDWLANERGYTLCEPKEDSLHGYYIPAAYAGPEQLMYDFFGLDRKKIDAEQAAILEAIRS